MKFSDIKKFEMDKFMDIKEKIANHYYDHNEEFPGRKPKEKKFKYYEEYEYELKEWKERYKKYNDEIFRLEEEFKKDLEEEFKSKNLPSSIRNELYNLAKDYSKNSYYIQEAIYENYNNFVKLVNLIINNT